MKKNIAIVMGIAFAIIFSAVSINNAMTEAEAEYKQQSCEKVCADVESAVTQIADAMVDELNPGSPYEYEYDDGNTHVIVNRKTGSTMMVSSFNRYVE